ncbi:MULTISPECIES: trypsin-like serine protease [unclassified Amycolatopsis]|uniref:S1 family peptidase n=1 Tax=unclassified Amycolatopsis TaxID=2618356 RepID=UPI0028766996|nr:MULTISPECIES: trypsin-like serine protease [unclassified Amycolatopsis]MDS0140551.1 trypsin-like serine protease [Amycolatopsis sp. 505]MDS0149201.1 trypsin-like serine protease [Amycolatopsis sp. CM201R]
MRRLPRLAGIVAAIGAAAAVTIGGVAASAAAAPPPPTGGPVQPNIVGGHAPSLQYPAGAFAALIYDAPAHEIKDHFTCTTAQLNGRFFTIAAHCVTDPPPSLSVEAKAALMRYYGLDATSAAVPTADKKFRVRVGSPDRTAGGTVVGVSVFYVHPGWSWGQGPESDDIALLKSDEYLNTYALPIAPRKPRPGDTVRTLGWGGTEPVFKGELPTQIQELTRKVIPAKNCVDAGITTRDICLDNPGGYSGDCNGDSGGPSVVEQDGVLYNAGPTSRGGSAICGATPDVSTSAAEFAKELNDAMRGNPPVLAHGVPVR